MIEKIEQKVENKKCLNCGKELFGLQKKFCTKRCNSKKYRENNLEYDKQRYENNRERILELNKKWRENNPEYDKKYGKQWREDNKEHRKEYDKQWRESNKEYRKEYDKQWHKNNPNYSKEYYRKLKKENPEKYKEYIEYVRIHNWAKKNIPYLDLDNKKLCLICNENFKNNTLDCANLNHEYNKIPSEWGRICRECHYLLNSLIREKKNSL